MHASPAAPDPLDPDAPIGVFDSGLGGLTVAAALARALPDESLLYLGDTARVPYGTRAPATVVRYAHNTAGFLRTRGVKLIVVACNTVSAHALDALTRGERVPVIGVIRPGARAALAASRGGEIAVLATPGTVASDAYRRAIDALAPGRRVHQIACPLLVPLAEEGWFEHPVTAMVAREYLAPLVDTGVDTIILGCTHYPLLRATLRAAVDALIGPHVTLIDSAAATAVDVAAALDRHGLRRATPGDAPRFFVTDAPDRAAAVAGRFWGDGRPELEHVDLQDAAR